jgi:hypothetical protein
MMLSPQGLKRGGAAKLEHNKHKKNAAGNVEHYITDCSRVNPRRSKFVSSQK